MYFEAKINYVKPHENGRFNKTTEVYLVKAESFTEAETKVRDYAYIYGIHDFTIKAIRIVNLSELFLDSGGSAYFNIVLSCITLDENRGYEKMKRVNVLVTADNIEHAKLVLTEGMKGTMIDYRIAAIKESNITDIIDEL